MILMQSLLCRRPGLPSCLLDGEAVLLDINQGAYLCFNGVASRIWELLSSPITCSFIIEQLLKEYEVPPAICEEATLSFLQTLLSKNLIDVTHPEN